MSDKITGYTEKTPTAMTTGAAVWFKNFDLATDTVASASAKIISATTGGITIGIEYDSWYREVDGLPENSMGMFERESVKPTIKGTMNEIASAQALADALGAAAITTATSPSGYQVVNLKPAVEDTAYLENITCICQTKGSDDPLIIVIDHPLSTEGFEIATEAKAGGGMEVTFTGFYDPLDLENAPIHFYVPTA